MFGSTEILIIGGVVLVLFGATAIPKFARSIGRAKREFELAANEARAAAAIEARATDDSSNTPRRRKEGGSAT